MGPSKAASGSVCTRSVARSGLAGVPEGGVGVIAGGFPEDTHTLRYTMGTTPSPGEVKRLPGATG